MEIFSPVYNDTFFSLFDLLTMTASILAIGTALPEHILVQKELKKNLIEGLKLPDKLKRWFELIFDAGGIETRYSVLSDFKGALALSPFFGEAYPEIEPSMGKRNAIYKQAAPELALQAAKNALKNYQGDPKEITDIVFVSCTGVLAPGIEAYLLEKLGLPNDTGRLGINLMGCFGAFKGLMTAKALAAMDPKKKILVVCCELCSLHFFRSEKREVLLGSALFGDGAGAVIVGNGKDPLWQLDHFRSEILPSSQDEMTWEAGDFAFEMKLTSKVPKAIRASIRSFTESLTNAKSFEGFNWALHPGGKAILEGIEKANGLTKDQTGASWEILKTCGNMSSATVLFVLEKMIGEKNIISLGFGPGLSVEGMVLR